MMPRLLAVAASTTMLAVASFLSLLSTPVRGGADDPPRSDQSAKAPAPASRSDFISEVRRTLTAQQDRMIELAGRVFRYEEDLAQLADQLQGRKTPVEAAKARFDNARLAREAAEIKVKEFTDGTFAHDLALIELEIKIAQEEVATSGEETKRAEDQLARIKQASTGSVGEISLEFGFEGKVVAAQLGERRAGFALAQAESRKKILNDYTKQKRLKELLSDREKARSEELARRAAWELELAKAMQLEREAKQNDLPRDLKRSLVLLDRAIAVQEQVRHKLDDVAKQGNITERLRKEIQDLTGQLRALVDEADGERAALQFDKLKPRIRSAADRATDKKKR